MPPLKKWRNGQTTVIAAKGWSAKKALLLVETTPAPDKATPVERTVERTSWFARKPATQESSKPTVPAHDEIGDFM